MVYNAAQAMMAVIRHTTLTQLDGTLEYIADQLDVFIPIGSAPNNEDIDDYIKNKCQAAKRKAEDQEGGSNRKCCRLRRSVNEDDMDVDTDELVRDRSTSQGSFPEVTIETEWPAGLRMTDSPLSDVEGVAGPSGLSTEEKEKEKMPREMEIEDVASPLGNPTANAKLVEKPVKVEEVPVNVNWVRYKVVEVLPREPAQPVIEGAPAKKRNAVGGDRGGR
jgi:hypothetical protein